MGFQDIAHRYSQIAARYGVRDVTTVHYIVMFIAAAHVLAVVTWAVFTARSEANIQAERIRQSQAGTGASSSASAIAPSRSSTQTRTSPRRRPRPKSENDEVTKGTTLRARLAALRAQRARASENSKDN